MRYLLMLLCFFCATSVASAKPMPTLNVLEPVPASIRRASMADYTRWAKAHNKLAYANADYRAREYNKRHPRQGITVITTEYEGPPLIDQDQDSYEHHRAPTRTTLHRVMIRQTQRTYRQPPWGGGPVVLLNPYCRPAGN